MILGLALMAMLAAPRPDWAESEPKKVGDGHQLAVVTEPFATRLECDAQLPQAAQKAIDQYVALAIGAEAKGRTRLDWAYIRDKLVKEQWEEPRQVTVSPTQQVAMVRLHVLLSIDKEADAHLRSTWQTSLVRERITAAGVLLGGLMLLMTIAWGYLRTDLSTGGRYRGRLRLAAVGIVALLAAGIFALARRP